MIHPLGRAATGRNLGALEWVRGSARGRRYGNRLNAAIKAASPRARAVFNVSKAAEAMRGIVTAEPCGSGADREQAGALVVDVALDIAYLFFRDRIAWGVLGPCGERFRHLVDDSRGGCAGDGRGAGQLQQVVANKAPAFALNGYAVVAGRASGAPSPWK